MLSLPSYRHVGAIALLLSCQVSAFQAPMERSRLTGAPTTSFNIPARISPPSISSISTTQLSMSYNLPPGGGGGGKDALGSVLSGALTIGAIFLFFASPLGGIFFAITNSLFLLALITPVILFVGFQVWQSLNTVSGPCPNCGVPARTMKDVNQPSICLNCGSILQVSPDLETIELSTPTSREGGGFIDMDQPGAGNMGGGGASIFDIFGGGAPEQPTSPEVKQKEQKIRRETTIVDVEVTKDD